MKVIQPIRSLVNAQDLTILNSNFLACARETEPIALADNLTLGNDLIDSVQIDATAGTRTVTLPAPGGNRRRRIIKTDASSNIVTIAVATAGQLINGLSSWTLSTQYSFVELEATDIGWLVVNSSTASDANMLLGKTWAIPGAIGSTTPNTGAFTTLAASGLYTGSISLAANTSGNGLLFTNPNTASSGNQRYSPRTVWGGFGFDTNSGASRSIQFVVEVVPVESDSLEDSYWRVGSSFNGGTADTFMTYTRLGDLTIPGTMTANQFVGTWSGAFVVNNYGYFTNYLKTDVSLSVLDQTEGVYYGVLQFMDSGSMSADRTLNISLNDADRTIVFGGNFTVNTPWTLGVVTAGAVALDAGNYVAVVINGVSVKLLKAA